MWQVTPDDIESIAIGAGILGTGGGGNPYIGKLRMQTLLQQGYTAMVIDLEELSDNALVSEIGVMGAPTVGLEKLPSGEEPRWVLEALEAYIGRTIDAVICAEIGGANSLEPLVAGALTGKPVVDADAMGRAFPEMQMSTHFINGVPCAPAAMVDEKGNHILFGTLNDPFTLERYTRDLCVIMGCITTVAFTMSGEQAQRTAVPRTLSLARRVGDAVRRARVTKEPITAAVLAVTGGCELFQGKLIDVYRRTIGGFARGELRVEGLGQYAGAWLHIAFQNENLVAWRGDQNTCDTVVACVPDLICILDIETGEPVTTEQLRYGLRITILGIPCSTKLRTPDALKVVGPQAFGYEKVTYTPMPKIPGLGLE